MPPCRNMGPARSRGRAARSACLPSRQGQGSGSGFSVRVMSKVMVEDRVRTVVMLLSEGEGHDRNSLIRVPPGSVFFASLVLVFAIIRLSVIVIALSGSGAPGANLVHSKGVGPEQRVGRLVLFTNYSWSAQQTRLDGVRSVRKNRRPNDAEIDARQQKTR